MATAENRVIELLPRRDREHLLAACEPVRLVPSEILCEPGKPMRHAYFPIDSLVSLLGVFKESPGLALALVGREGLVGAQLARGAVSLPFKAVVLGSGPAWRIRAPAFRRELLRSAALRGALDEQVYGLMTQLATAAGCLRFHLLGPRLARWLLMSESRSPARVLRVTHETLAGMLGVRRSGITVAACALQRSGLIEYRRGQLRVLDRGGLEAASCGCQIEDGRLCAAAPGRPDAG